MARDFVLPRSLPEGVQKRMKEVYLKIEKKIRNISSYTAVSLARSPKRVKTQKPDGSKKVNNKNWFTYETPILEKFGKAGTFQTVRKYLAEKDKKGERYKIASRTPIKTFQVFKKGSEPGEVPKSWDGPGRAKYYISQRDTGKVNDKGKKIWVNNWQVEELNSMEYEVSLKPLGGRNSNFLQVLEKGGTLEGDSFIKGYNLFKEWIKNSKQYRYYFYPIRQARKVTSISPRPFVNRTLEKVRQKAGNEIHFEVK